MIKDTFKKIGALVCAFTIASQIMIASPAAIAAPLKENIIYNEVAVEDANKEWSYSNADKTETNSIKFTSPSNGSYFVNFDITLNTLLKNDPMDALGGRGRSTFYMELAGAKDDAGGVLQASKQTTVDGKPAMSFHWKDINTSTDFVTFKVGETYNVTFVVNSTTNKIDVIAVDEAGKEICNKTGNSMRAAVANKVTQLIIGTNARPDETDSVTIDNMISYQNVDDITMKLDGSEPSTTTEQVIDLHQLKSEEFGVKVSASLLGELQSNVEIVTELVMQDGTELPDGLEYDSKAGKIITDGSIVGSDDVKNPLSYKTFFVAYVEGYKDSSVKYPIVFNKVNATDKTLVNDYYENLKLASAVAGILDPAAVTEDLVLNTGSSRVKISWISSNKDVISDTGVVLPAKENTDVKLTAEISAVQDPEIKAKREFDVTVLGADSFVKNTIESIKIVSADDGGDVDLSNLFEDIAISVNYDKCKYIDVTWKSSSGALVLKEGIASIYLTKAEKVNVNLDAVVNYVKDGKILSSTTKTFPIVITLDADTATDRYAVRSDVIATSNFRDLDSDDDITSDITLKTKGEFGSKITWSSSKPLVISNTGEVKRGTSKSNVTLTAKVSKGNQTQTMKFELTVPAKKGSSSGSSNTSSGTKVTYSGNPNVNPIVNPDLEQGKDTTVNKFMDLGNVAWAEDAINQLFNKGVITGRTSNIFAPNDDITRAEFAQLVTKAFGIQDTAATTSLSDVKQGEWYYTAVASASNKGIIKGYADGSFGINDKITRQDMAVIIYRAAQVTGKTISDVNSEINFADSANIENYAKEAVTALQKGGVINGMSDTEFAPTATATRAQAATMIYGLIK